VVDVAVATTELIPNRKEFIGPLSANYSATIQPRIAGFLASSSFENGMPVRRGQLIFTLDDAPQRASRLAAEASLSSPLLDDNMITGAKNILLNFAVTDINNLLLEDVTEAAQYIQKHATYVDDDGVEHNADIIWGASEKSTLADDELELVVIATGFADGRDPKIKGTYVEAMGADPFGEGESIREPQPPKSPMPPSTPASITPLQKRYGYIAGWIQEPAYMRRKMGMIAGSDSHLKSVTFRPLVKDSEEETPQASAGVLF
jgi:cell division protein FtsZ